MIDERFSYSTGGLSKFIDVQFDDAAAAAFYAAAAASGAMQVINSVGQGFDADDEGDVVVFIYAPTAPPFTRQTILGERKTFTHGRRRWGCWGEFMDHFGAGAKVSDDINVGWSTFNGSKWVDCAPPFQTGRILG